MSAVQRVSGYLSSLIELLRREGAGGLFARNAVTSFLLLGGGTGLGFLVQVYIARVMGAAPYGVFIYVISWINILTVLTKAGWDGAQTRFLPAYMATQRWDLARGVIQTGLRRGFLHGAILAALGILVAVTQQSRLGLELSLTLGVGMLALPLTSGLAIRAGALQALKRVVHAQAPEQVLRPLLMAILVLVFTRGYPLLEAPAAFMLTHVVALALVLLLQHHWLRRGLPAPLTAAPPAFEFPQWKAVILPLAATNLINLALSQIDMVLVGFFRGTTEAGYYSVSGRLAQLVVFGLVAINTVTAPMISQLYAQGKMDQLQKLATQTARALFAYCVPVVIFMILFGRYALGLFGKEFVQCYPILVVQMLGQLINALTGSVGLMLNMTGHQTTVMRLLAGAGILGIVLNLLLLPRFGLLGAAITGASILAGVNIVMAILVRRRLGIRTTLI